MTTIKNSQLHPAMEAIVALRDERLPVSTSIEIRYLVRELEAQAQIVEAERVDLLKRCNGVDENGTPDGRLTAESPEWATFIAEYTTLMEMTFEVRHILTEDMLWRRGAEGERVPLELPLSVVLGLGDILQAGGDKP